MAAGCSASFSGPTSPIPLQEPVAGRTFRVQAPAQVQISEELPLAEAEALMAASGMAPPLVVKPVWTDGREGSHGLAVVHDMASLSNLLAGEAGSGVKPPVVIQEFVEHGGVLFKVCVWGGNLCIAEFVAQGGVLFSRYGGASVWSPWMCCRSLPGR